MIAFEVFFTFIRLMQRFASTRCASRVTAFVNVRHIHRSDDRKLHSVKDHVVDKTPITAQLWQMRKQDNNQDNTQGNMDGSTLVQTVALPKTAEESRISVRYNFHKDTNLRDLYVDHTGNVLVGKLFEDMDALAGNVANKHCCDDDPLTKRLSLVTASVDEILQRNPIPVQSDIILTGQVAWVGKSSLDVLVEVHDAALYERATATTGGSAMLGSAKSRLLSSFFTYVARNRDTDKAAVVNPLLVTSPQEEHLQSVRNSLAVQRKAQRSSGGAAAGSAERDAALQKLIEAGSAMEDMPALAHPNAVLMKLTGLENSVVCQPQNVNTAGRVFGGYIMHRAFDLALATSYIFSGVYPVFLEVDKILFRKPVDIGDLLRLKSRVIYTDDSPLKPMVVVEVTCQVVRPERAASFVSNTFHFVFGFPPSAPVSLRRVLPVTAEEAHTLIIGQKATESSKSCSNA